MAGGRPPIFKDKQGLQSRIDEYLTNPPVKVVVTKDGPIEVPAVTITGLALHLGFESRQSLHDYEKRDEFSYIIVTSFNFSMATVQALYSHLKT